ncbi:MAG: LPXTG cell wall anchor domain-containing protein [Clostridiales bacterium]|nr:LPXTG cell wall anchor domain-containing protein [Clostridiales bacterium]
MPKTGEPSPLPFYIAGACAIVLGASLIVNKGKS